MSTSGKVHGRNGVVIIGGYDISSDATSVDTDEGTATAKSTGMGGTEDETFVVGQNDNKINVKGIFDDTAATGIEVAYDALKGTFFPAAFMPAGDTQGYAAICAATQVPTDDKTTSPVAGVVTMDTNFQISGPSHHGKVVQGRTTATGTGAAQNQASSLDNGASTSNGGEVYFFINNVGAGTVSAFKLQHSADNITFTDLVTSGLAGTAISGEHQTVAAGTNVNRYLRVTATCTNGVSYTTTVTFKRN